ncbi:olfactory receptor 10A5-like [Emydura macquarii macquarii]|uniref:olfactory receptor 10A5-like n=1 Tax=Emydura macquarii macquarii TaxID=1129001 RepID=UPI003529E368
MTVVTDFILFGFFNILQLLLFVVFLVIYMVTLMGDILIILITVVDPALHSPMYFFFRNLSFMEICFNFVIIPKMLVNLLLENKAFSFYSCMLQMYFFFPLGSSECFLRAAMAYDRYVTICKPLHYSVVMDKTDLFYSTAGLTYFWPKSTYSSDTKKLLLVSCMVITPMLNPIIYSLRNKEVKWALRRTLGRKISL